MPPNVLLIVFDTARADAFEPYGGGVGTSPTMSQLAGQGSALPAAYAPSNWTLPSHVSMLSGLEPRATGLLQAPEGNALKVRPVIEALRDRLLPEVLRRSGYSTRAVSANAWISQATGFSTGFDTFEEVLSERHKRISSERVRGRLHWMVEGARARSDDGAKAAESIIHRWLDEGPSQPFFWFVNLVECHSPYLPPRPYNDLTLLARLRAVEDVRHYQTLATIWRTCTTRRPIPAQALARMRHLYGRSIRALDDWLARILEQMDRRGLLEGTLVIVTSDHGENLGEGNLIGHAFSLSEQLIHVPLIVAGPGAFSTDQALSLTALPSLVAQALQLSEHPWGQRADDEGVVVSEYGSLGSRTAPGVAEWAAEWGLDDEGISRLTSAGIAATDGTMKLVREHGPERLYDLRADPLETHPIDAREANGRVARLRSAVEKVNALRPVVTPGAPAGTVEENAELEERLKLLGYM